MIELTVKENEQGQTLEKYVKKFLSDAPLSFIYKLFRKKDVKVNKHWQDNKYIINQGDVVQIYISDEQLLDFRKKKLSKTNSDLALAIVYEDENIIIINKPRNVLVQKDDSGDPALDDMVISYLINKKEYDPNIDFGFKPAPLHRLDRNTAGLILFGKNLPSIQEGNKIINDKSLITKKYLTLVEGTFTNKEGTISLPLKKLTNGRVIVDQKEGKEAITKYMVKETFGNYSLLEVTLLTGRTHQIRVHLSSINHPVIGDAKYGDYPLNKEIENLYHFKNQFLIAYDIKFNKLTGKLAYLSNKEFKIDMPNEFMDLLTKLKDNK